MIYRRTLLQLSLLLGLLLGFLGGKSQQEANSMLWRISGNHLKAPSYLLGTLHISCGDDFEIKPKVKAVLQLVKTITFEADINNTEGGDRLLELTKPVPGILDTLQPRKLKLLDSLLKQNNLTQDALRYTSPFGLMSVLTVKTFNCPNASGIKMMEPELYSIAQNYSLQVDHLESVDYQIGLVQSTNTIDELIASMQDMKTAPAFTKQLVQDYRNENLSKLTALMNNPRFMNPADEIKLLRERNRNWITLLPEKMKSSPTLFAVGAGHLGGTDGLINLLRKKGYTLTPVYN
ncbi:MAG: TraB/GumN family protein [Niabella sp.]|nr:TraB/GumN family protein [Niabella sp.]